MVAYGHRSTIYKRPERPEVTCDQMEPYDPYGTSVANKHMPSKSGLDARIDSSDTVIHAKTTIKYTISIYKCSNEPLAIHSFAK